jgi:cadmium resistance protein CadD (predicted permease)
MVANQEALSQTMLMQQVITSGGAFMATNVDDIVLLTLLFSRLPQRSRALPLVVGQVLGFSLLVAISLIGFSGRWLIPRGGLALLGLLPIGLGIRRCWQEVEVDAQPRAPAAGAGPLAESLAMAGLTFANGSDNIGVYLPLFAQADPLALVVTLVTFAVGLLLWLLLAWTLTRTPAVVPLLRRCSRWLVPVVLIGLGVLTLLAAGPGR